MGRDGRVVMSLIHGLFQLGRSACWMNTHYRVMHAVGMGWAFFSLHDTSRGRFSLLFFKILSLGSLNHSDSPITLFAIVNNM
jgi:hypothetical protein